jgi:hypothetical protein
MARIMTILGVVAALGLLVGVALFAPPEDTEAAAPAADAEQLQPPAAIRVSLDGTIVLRE